MLIKKENALPVIYGRGRFRYRNIPTSTVSKIISHVRSLLIFLDFVSGLYVLVRVVHLHLFPRPVVV